ncbi:GatB/YqeY domain-containing protein [Mesoaciditoga sp.]
MGILDELSNELKNAIMQKDELRKRVLRMLISAVKNFEISSGKSIDEDDFDKIVKKQIKEREEAMQDYERAGRSELYNEEKAERDILKTFAKPELSDEEIKKAVEEKAKELSIASKKEFGKLMGAVMRILKGKASGERIKSVVEMVLEDIEKHST